MRHLDPWKWASLLQSNNKVVARVANCTNCAHCVDLYTPTSSDSLELRKIRDEQFLSVSEWVEAYWRGLKGGHSLHAKSVNILTV